MNTDYRKAVSRVAWSIILTTFHFKIGIFDLLPDWLGYIFLFLAIEPIGRFQPSANLLKPFGVILTINAVFMEILEITGTKADIYIYNLIICVMYIYLYFQLLTDIYHTVEQFNMDSGGMIPILRNITTITYTIAFVISNVAGNTFVVYAAAAVNIFMKALLAFHLFSHSSDAKQRNMEKIN